MAKGKKTELVSFADQLVYQYFYERNPDFLKQYFSADCSIIEPDFVSRYSAEKKINQNFSSIETLETGVSLYKGEFEILSLNQKQTYEVSLLLQQKEENLKCIHLHCSPKQQYADSQEERCKIEQQYADFQKKRCKIEQQYADFQKKRYKIEQQKLFLDRVFQSMMCGVICFGIQNDSFSSVKMNPEAERIFGYESEKDCIRQGVSAFFARFHPDDRVQILKQSQSLKQTGDYFQFECRIQLPCREITWVYGMAEFFLNEKQAPVTQFIVLDVTDKKQLELALQEEHERFRIAVEITPAIIFEYHIEKDCYKSYGTLEEEAEQRDVEVTLSDYIQLHLKDQVESTFFDAYASFLRGENGHEMEIRMAPCEGNENRVWSRVSISIIYGHDQKPSRVIGKITNIQSEKEKEFELERTRSRDNLTGLWKKEYGIQVIQNYLSQKDPKESCALFLLDMDNFKKVNETEGIVFSDVILQEVADIVLSNTKKEDVQIRLGGDEFMILIKNIGKKQAAETGRQIASQVRHVFAKISKEIPISVSVGIYVSSEKEYSRFYQCAETALKYVKKKEKGQAACYSDTFDQFGVTLISDDQDYFVNEIGKQAVTREENLVPFALELLGKAINLKDAIFLLLARIGKLFQFDRVSILEMNQDYLICRIPYQWSKNPSDFQIGKDYYMDREKLASLIMRYDAEGICIETPNQEMEIPSLGSCIHAAIWNYGIYAGAIRFEVKEKGYLWTEKQCNLLKELVKIIPSFIMKARADAVSQAKTDFLSRMSHEIRTPMNAIAGMTTIARTVLEDREKLLDCLEKIESANVYLISLINDILDMSKIESGKMELDLQPMNLKKVMGKIESLLKPQAIQKNIRMVFQNETEQNPVILADELRLNQILINIIGNAIKFTEPFGHILFRITPVKETRDGISICFSVKDTGIGISENAMKRIFNAFEQAENSTSSRFGGTGLGLAISSKLVQMMGGILSVKSQEGKGSEFYFTLPFSFAEEKETSSDQKTVLQEIFYFEGKRILLAEDNLLNQEIAKTILEMNGLAVDTADNGKEACQKFLENPPFYYDAILMDIRMPVMNGLDAAKNIRTMKKQDSRTIPIIAMTANAFDADTKRSIESGMNDHLTKPVHTQTLLKAIQNCIGLPKNDTGEQSEK